MKEHPIIFTSENAQKIRDGNKTQTRRIVKPQPLIIHIEKSGIPPNVETEYAAWNSVEGGKFYVTPKYKVGDHLWVKEPWRVHKSYDTLTPSKIGIAMGGDVIGCIDYMQRTEKFWGKTRNRMFMPRWASRITLEVVDVRVQRVQEISVDDVAAEGIDLEGEHALDFAEAEMANSAGLSCGCRYPEIFPYRRLWDFIHGAGAWERNDWVWAYAFKVIK